jgi:16S rRNA (adenine1518-N6/adenine1519-N6)-dimethyltransferase
MKLLEDKLPIENIIVMVQKEAADRLTAEVGTRNSGAITVAVNFYAKAEKLFDVFRDSFMPAPKVDSAVIRLSLCDKAPVSVKDEKLFFKMVRAIFMQRRKTAANGISAGMGIPKQQVADALLRLGFDENIRAEALSLDALCALSDELSDR